jgi:hypothetical protein
MNRAITVMAVLMLLQGMMVAQEKCESSIDSYAPEVRAQMKYPIGFSFSVTDKRIARLGDGASVVLLRYGIAEKPVDPIELQKVLYILHTSFSCGLCIIDKENKTPHITFALLDLLRTRTSENKLRAMIREAKNKIKEEIASKEFQ